MRFLAKCFLVGLLLWSGHELHAQQSGASDANASVFKSSSTNTMNTNASQEKSAATPANTGTTMSPEMAAQLGETKPSVSDAARASLAMLATKKQKLSDTLAFLSQQYTELTKQLLDVNHKIGEATEKATAGWDLAKWKLDDNPDSETWLDSIPAPAKNPAAEITGSGAQPHAAVPPAAANSTGKEQK